MSKKLRQIDLFLNISQNSCFYLNSSSTLIHKTKSIFETSMASSKIK